MSERTQYEIKTIEKEIQERKCQFNNLDCQKRKERLNDAIRMIEYHRASTDAIEERRNRVYENALTIMGAIVGAFIIIYSFNLVISFDWFVKLLICFLCIFFLTQLIVVIKYYKQSNISYPFNSDMIKDNFSNQWKWFYRGHPIIRKMVITTDSPEDRNTEADGETYLEGLNLTFKMHLTESMADEYYSAITQMYLLMVHNAYKNQFYLELIRIQKKGLKFSIIIPFIFATIWELIEIYIIGG